jgi:hypothetical protein
LDEKLTTPIDFIYTYSYLTLGVIATSPYA